MRAFQYYLTYLLLMLAMYGKQLLELQKIYIKEYQ